MTIATTVGTLSLTNTAGLTLSYDNHWSGDPSITFSGSQADLDAGLATAELSPGDSGGSSANVSITAMVADTDHVYLAPNQHFYEYVADPGVDWSTADTAARAMTFDGQSGYLATIPNSTVNNFVSAKIEGAQNVWFGATAYDTPGATYPRTWRWAQGVGESPLAGNVISYCDSAALNTTCDSAANAGLFSSWAWLEPNNSGSTGENRAVTNWMGGVGYWNDVPDADSMVQGYIVEFGDRAIGSTGFTGVVRASSSLPVVDVPAAPTDVRAQAGAGAATVTFDPADAHGSAVRYYTVTAMPGGRRATCPTSPCTLSGLSDRQAYTFTVTATNAQGAGPASVASGTVTPHAPPPAYVHIAPTTVAARSLTPVCSINEATVSYCAVIVYADGAVVGVGRAARKAGQRSAALPVPVALNRQGQALVARPGGAALLLRAGSLTSGSSTIRGADARTTMVAPHVALRRVYFAFDSAHLDQHAAAYLKQVSAQLGDAAGVQCSGHSDYAANNRHERALSRRRAQTVCALLTRGHHHVRARAHGDGGAHPVTTNGSARSRRANRFVAVTLTY
ncbi:OmpA family protein [uncultured Jatrophihabitans sp.]|uniref:OmpA family protein n=1 Tax=uncultured Jatrophihabitans sp. TaxID=1610747 RepID=UPI0035CA983C